MRHLPIIIAVFAALPLVACTEQPQTSTARKADQKPWDSTNAVYAASGYKAGDRAAWEQQMKTRAQGQDEYGRTAK